MQSALVILATLLLYGLCQYEYISRRRASNAAKEEPEGSQEKPPFATRQIRILIASMVEFQKAQCFYAMAVQAATLIFIFEKGNTYSTVDVYALLAIGRVGIVPMIGNLYALMRFGKGHGIYSASLCAVGLFHSQWPSMEPWVPSLMAITGTHLTTMLRSL